MAGLPLKGVWVAGGVSPDLAHLACRCRQVHWQRAERLMGWGTEQHAAQPSWCCERLGSERTPHTLRERHMRRRGSRLSLVLWQHANHSWCVVPQEPRRVTCARHAQAQTKDNNDL